MILVLVILVLVVAVAYAAMALYAARWLYGHWRARSVDRYAKKRYPYTTAGAIKDWNEIDRGPAMVAAALCALAWPAVLVISPLAVFTIRFMASTPVLSRAEMRDRLAERDKHIAELEREAGIRP